MCIRDRRLATRVLLRVEADVELDIDALERCLSTYRQRQGCPVSLRYINSKARAWLHLDDKWRVRPCDGLMHDLQRLMGPESVKFGYRGERPAEQSKDSSVIQTTELASDLTQVQPTKHAQAS